MRSGATIVGLFIAGCSSSSMTIAPIPHAGSVLVVGYKLTGATEWTMTVAEGAEATYLTLDDSPYELVAYSYAALELPRGPLPKAEGRDCRLLYYDVAFRASLSGVGAPVQWDLGSAPTHALDEVLFGPNTQRCTGGCWTWTEDAAFPVTEEVAFAVEGPGGVLIGGRTGALEKVSSDGSLERICSAAASPTATVTAGAWDGADGLWFGYSSGALGYASLAAQRASDPCAIQTATITADRYPIRGLAVAPAGQPLEVFTISSTVARASYFRRWDGTAFGQELVVPEAHSDVANVVWLSPGTALGVVIKSSLLLLRPGSARSLSLGIDVTGVNQALGESLSSDGNGGAWVGVAHLGLLRLSPPDDITITLRDPNLRTVRSLTRWEDRSFFMGNEGLMTQAPDREPPCASTKVFASTAPGATSNGVFGVRRLGPTRMLAVQADERDIHEALVNRRHLVLGLHRP